MKRLANVSIFVCLSTLATIGVVTGQFPALGHSVEVSAVGSCKIVYDDKCGDFGRKAYVANTDTTHAVLATVEIRWQKGGDSGSYQVVKGVPAGGKVYVGCTDGGGFPRKNNTFTVTGCQKL